MFESLISYLFANWLSTYFANLTREKLRIGVWSGEVVLTDLELRRNALEALELPLFVITGRIGRLVIRVP